MRFSNVLASATVLCVVSAAGALAQNGGFCGNYAQTWSNAGQCEACRLMIADNPEIQTYFVEANNGWSAELTWAHGDPSDAVGRGAWNDASDDHSRQGFDIDLVQDGDILRMKLTHYDKSLGGTIEGEFTCID